MRVKSFYAGLGDGLEKALEKLDGLVNDLSSGITIQSITDYPCIFAGKGAIIRVVMYSLNKPTSMPC